MYVDNDFELITFDFVTEPSTVDAFLAPMQRRYSGSLGGGGMASSIIPDQAKIVQIAHLGHGVCSMDNISRLPKVKALVSHIRMLQGQVGSPPIFNMFRGKGGASAFLTDALQLDHVIMSAGCWQ